MQFKKALIWSHIKGTYHRCLTEDEQKKRHSAKLIAQIFPGMEHYSSYNFARVRQNYLIPVLQKQFPNLATIPAEEIGDMDMVEITEFLPCDRYAWQESAWQAEFNRKLAA